MDPLSLVKLKGLMELTSGRAEVMVGLIDGPVVINHADLATENIREVPGSPAGSCSRASSPACVHGTFVAGILSAKRNSKALAICPGCTLLVRPIFPETPSENGQMPGTTPQVLAGAIIDTIEAGARVVNLSLALEAPTSRGQRELEEALNFAANRGAILVAAAGNQGTIGGSALTQHECVIPVAGYDLRGRPLKLSNLGSSIGRHGLGAPAEGVTSLGTDGNPLVIEGTSAATPFVSGAIALLWSAFPSATSFQLKSAITRAPAQRRSTVVPPLMDAWAAYQIFQSTKGRS